VFFVKRSQKFIVYLCLLDSIIPKYIAGKDKKKVKLLDGGERSTSSPGRFTLGETALGVNFIGVLSWPRSRSGRFGEEIVLPLVEIKIFWYV